MWIIFIVTSCTSDSRYRSKVVGSYLVHDCSQHKDKDGTIYDIDLTLQETFDWFSVQNDTRLSIVFHFDKPFEFPSITLNYNVEAKGDWSVRDTVLYVAMDTAGVIPHFLGSTAKTPTEESMARILRSMVKEKYQHSVKRQMYLLCNRKAQIVDANDTALVLLPMLSKEEEQRIKEKNPNSRRHTIIMQRGKL
ncbi:MAG: hypothetical protein HUJ96_08810 [Marinilabiliaceae bacterium]|mgnify:FL=1|nr:hypothetical protein [Marinilabiliaceae bacterium]